MGTTPTVTPSANPIGNSPAIPPYAMHSRQSAEHNESHRAPPLPPITTSGFGVGQYQHTESVTTELANSLLPPPLIHSHSFPNGHQLPSQLQGFTPSTPVVPSPSFTASLGINHAPIISSPLATMPVSRAPSPPRSYSIPEQVMAEPSSSHFGLTLPEPDMPLSRRTSLKDARADGRPVILRSRSTSINRNWNNLPTMTSSLPLSVLHNSRPVSPSDDDDEDESEEEGPRRTKRRRSSAGRDDAPDPGFINGPVISDDIRRQLDNIFEDFLNGVCSDRE